ncbi:MAG: energy transducer TonB [Ferruginibacter sp.]|nr:energy transducer TonB [Ferruginibacter sp.]
MSSHNKNNYTARDIEKYLAGKLSPSQMHAMEKAALDDPFLADAMEGYEMFKDKNFDNELASLQQQLAQKSQGAKVIPLHKSKSNWWKAIAAILVLGAGAWVTYLFNQKNNTIGTKETPIAWVKTITPDSGLQIQTPSANTASVFPDTAGKIDEVAQQQSSTTKPTAVKKDNNDKKIAGVANNEPGGNAIIAAEKTKESAPLSNAAAVRQNQTDEMATVSKKQVSKAAIDNEANRGKIETTSSARKESTLNNYFTAQVVSGDNTPLPFTNISVKKDNFGTYADAKGMIRLVSTDSVLKVDLKSVGYLPKTITLYQNQPQTKIVLQEDDDKEKNYSVVANKKSSSSQNIRKPVLIADSVVNVEPADGWEKYNTYVANNLEIPDEMLQRDIHGEVELRFDVKKNGTISNIVVNKSMGAQYDEAAKRLLLEGPQWKVKKGKKNSASIKVKF